jgi:pimeloyl-ACP methyl ester carboxylesterase
VNVTAVDDHQSVNQRAQKVCAALRRILFSVTAICGAFYLLVCLAVARWQRKLLYFPPVFTQVQVDYMAGRAGLQRWTNSAGQAIGMKRPSPLKPATGQIMVMYGNGGSAVGCSHYADEIQSVAPLNVYILEYPGYEDRAGFPSQGSFFRAADEAIQALPAGLPIYLVGESLGTGVASHLAGAYPNQVRGVVLMAPFNCLADVAQYHYPFLPVRLLLRDHFPSDVSLRNYHGPLGILVGGQDQVVPEKFGRRLYDGFDGPKKLWEFPPDGHNDVFGELPQVLTELLELWQVKH